MVPDRVRLTLAGALSFTACSEVVLAPDDEEPTNSSAGGSSAMGGSGSTSAGPLAGGGAAVDPSGGAGGGGGPPGQVPGIVAVGYGGLRIVSRDDGVTWADRVTDGPVDDIGYNLWSVAWGAGRWVAAGGSRMLTSTDGVTWTDDTASMPYPSCAGVASFQGELWLGCSPEEEGRVYRSADGLSWGEPISLGQPFQYRVHLLVGGGTLVAHDNSGTALQSADGVAWAPLGLALPSFCEGEWKPNAECGPDEYGSSWHDGTWLAASWPGVIRRSIDGSSYTDAYVDPEGYTVFDSRIFARGYVAP